MSVFWKYFRDVLAWPLNHAPGPVQALVKGLALTMDGTRDDAVYLRSQFFPGLCAEELVSAHGASRGIVRHPRETADQFRSRVIKAYRWHLLGGKTEGLPEILRFYGFDALAVDNLRRCQPSRWAEFQIGLATPTTQQEQQFLLGQVENLVWLVNEYKPARSMLARLYTDTYNREPTIYSQGPLWSDGFYSQFSGVPVPGLDDLIVSFGMVYLCRAEQADPRAEFGVESALGMLIPYVDRPMWSRSDWGATYPLNSGFTVGELFSVHWCAKITASASWEGAWDARPWAEDVLWDRILPAWTLARRSWCKAQAVPSWPGAVLPRGRDGAYGDINACYSVPTVVISGKPPRWGAFAYSDEDRRRQEIPILEQFHEVFRAAAAPFHAEDELSAVSATDVARAAPVHTDDHAVWGRSRWGDSFAPYRAQHFITQSTRAVQSGERLLAPQAWAGAWDARQWAETAGWGHALPAWSMQIMNRPLSQAVYSGGAVESGVCYGVPTATITGTPPRWGDGAYSDNTPARTRLTITERRTALLTVSVDPVQPGRPQTTLHSQEV